MTLSTWIVFAMTAFCFFHIGRWYQRRSDKELHALAKEIIEEAKKRDLVEAEAKIRSGL